MASIIYVFLLYLPRLISFLLSCQCKDNGRTVLGNVVFILSNHNFKTNLKINNMSFSTNYLGNKMILQQQTADTFKSLNRKYM